MRAVLVTGAQGFIGRNLCVRLGERPGTEVIGIGRDNDDDALAAAADRAGLIFHVAGVNRPADEAEFEPGNLGFTEKLCAVLAAARSQAPIVYASSTRAVEKHAYGRSKRAAEDALFRHGEATGAPVQVYRLTNVFGKWARPNYNSAVATFCHNVAHGLDIVVNVPAAPLDLLYIDDLVEALLALVDDAPRETGFGVVGPIHSTTVGEVADTIRAFPSSRESMVIPRVGAGLLRALYSTFLSYLPPASFAYSVPVHSDARGVFVEMLKTLDSGQMSYFTAGPGVTRGNHYHHTKAEKFLVIAGEARFGFRHIVTGEAHEIIVRGGEGRVIETSPGWTHNITNIGTGDLAVMLWANELFDPERPDTIAMRL
jgi:UDP-2-acetamido-2,6-beta-L-arabino-hexul-4-ose reductase